MRDHDFYHLAMTILLVIAIIIAFIPIGAALWIIVKGAIFGP